MSHDDWLEPGSVVIAPTRRVPSEDRTSEQALIKEAHRRRRRRRCALGAMLVAAAVLGTALLVDSGGRPPPSSESGPASAPRRFVPPTTTQGQSTTMLIRLPDGRGFSLSYASSLRLDHSELTTSGQVDWPQSPEPRSCCSKVMAPYYGPVSSLFSGRPIATYRGVRGTVPYYSGAEAAFPYTAPNMDYLAFSFGPWTVLVSDPVRSEYFTARMTAHQRRVWAASFDAHISKSGFLIYTPRLPLRVVRGSIDVTLRSDAGLVEIAAPQTCSARQTDPQEIPAGNAWCDGNSDVHLSVTGQPSFVSGASASLGIRPLSPVGR